MLDLWTQLGIIAPASILVMALLWFVQRRTGDAGIVDVGWSFLLGFSAIFCGLTGEGSVAYRLVIGLVAGFWGLRLGWHILTDRVLSGVEDGRYQMLREKAGDKIQPILFGFYQAQAILVPILSIPFALAASTPDASLGVLAIVGVCIWSVGILGEAIADRQLKRFKRMKDPNERVCKVGLWRYSRHPNYFFEWLMWIGYALIATSAPMGWLAWSAPVLMLLLITKVTGIPPTEARAVRSRGEAYREYQRTTSAFFPWPPRTQPS